MPAVQSSAAAARAFAASSPTAASRTARSGPTPGSPTAAAHAAITSNHAGTGSDAGLSSSGPGGVPPNGPDPSSSGGGGGGWFFPALTVAAAGGGYYAYTQKNADGSSKVSLPELSREKLDTTQKAALDMLNKSKEKIQEFLPAALGGSSKGSKPSKPSSSSSASDKLVQQKQRDHEEAGFKMLPPGSEDASATAAAADAAAAASAAARDSLTAAADEFPGSTAGAAAAGASSSRGDYLIMAGGVGVTCAMQQQQVQQSGRAVNHRAYVSTPGFSSGVVLKASCCHCVVCCTAGPAVFIEDLGGMMDLEHVDVTPITDLFADVTGAEEFGWDDGFWYELSCVGNTL